MAKFTQNDGDTALMAGHALLNQVSEIRDAINIDGEVYYIHLSWYRLADVPGYVVGLKFTDYNAQAIRIHRRVKQKLQYLTSCQVQGGAGWIMSEKPAEEYGQFHIFENELAKQVRIVHHVD